MRLDWGKASPEVKHGSNSLEAAATMAPATTRHVCRVTGPANWWRRNIDLANDLVLAPTSCMSPGTTSCVGRMYGECDVEIKHTYAFNHKYQQP